MKLRRERTPARFRALESFGRRWACCGFYGADTDTSRLAIQGPSLGQSPEVLMSYRNGLVRTNDLSGAGWTRTNLTSSGPADNATTPLFERDTFLLTDTSAVAVGFIEQAISGIIGANNNCVGSCYFLLGSGAGTVRFQIGLEGGPNSQVFFVDFLASNGQIVTQQGASDVQFFYETFITGVVGAQSTWLRVNLIFNTRTEVTVRFSIRPDNAAPAGLGTIRVCGPMVAMPFGQADNMPQSVFRNPAYIPFVEATTTNTSRTQQGRIPLEVLDVRVKTLGEVLTYTIDWSRDLGRTIMANSAGSATITFPNPSSVVPDGWWCIIDSVDYSRTGGASQVNLTIAGGTIRLIGSGDSTTPVVLNRNDGVFPAGNYMGQVNAFRHFVYYQARNDQWHIAPIATVHNAGVLFITGGVNFIWPLGVDSVIVTSSAGGAGGINGGVAAGGGGGGGGAIRRTRFQGTAAYASLLVTIGAGGAAGVNGGNTSLGALFTLTGGLAGAGAVGGVGGAGAQDGEHGLVGSRGGGNIAGGIGGVVRDTGAVSTAGQRGGGGGGGSIGQNAGAGGAGFILIEW